MKKLMTIAAAALCASVFADGITSANVVGYQTISDVAYGKFKALAVQFENVAGGELAIKDLVKVGTPAGGGAINATADQIWLWDTEKADWVKYFTYKPRGAKTYTWCNAGSTTETTDTISSGTTFFFYRGGSAATDLTLAGAVKEFKGQQQYSVAYGKFVFMAYPWPYALKIAGFEAYQTTPAGGGAINATTDQIWRWNTEKADWDKYFCYKPRGAKTYTWCKSGETTATTDEIPVGEGFFFYRGGSAEETVTFAAPTTL